MSWQEIPRSLQVKVLHAAAITTAQLARLVGQLQQNDAGLADLKLMLRRFQGLAAWAGLHGLAGIAVAAQLGEHDCATLAGAGIQPDSCHLEQIASLVQVLRQEIYRQRTSGGVADEILWGKPPSRQRTTGGIADEILWATPEQAPGPAAREDVAGARDLARVAHPAAAAEAEPARAAAPAPAPAAAAVSSAPAAR